MKEIVVQPIGNSMDGIVNKLKNLSINPLNIIEPVSSRTYPKTHPEIISKDKEEQVCCTSTAWILFTFKRYLIFPTYYSLREGVATSHSYSKQWTLFGFNEDNKNEENKWDVLGTYENSEEYCGNSTGCKQRGYIKTFPIKTDKMKGYKYIKLNITAGSHTDYISYFSYGFDFFGKLSPNRICTPNLRNRFRPTILQAILIISL